MKVGKHVEEALRSAQGYANYDIEQADKDIARYTMYFDDYRKKLEDAQAKRSEAMDRKLEIRAALIKFGLDPEKEW